MKYRCKFNGVILDFDDKDAQQMDSHEGYERVEVEVVEKNEDLVYVVDDVAPPALKKKKKKSKK